MTKSHRVTGGGGAELHVVESGNPQGRPILYLHGLSQCWLQWGRQLNSDLTHDHRLVAMDMRGHGLSDKPLQGYDDSKLWADDVNAVINSLGLHKPLLCGWSYGPLLILDYIRHFGEDHIGGLHFIGAATKLGSEDAVAVLTPEFLGLLPGLFSTDVKESVSTLQPFLRLCFAQEPTDEELFLMMGWNVSVPPFVRQALLSRSVNNDDILPKIRKPVLITHGANDSIVKPAAVSVQKASMAHAQVHMMENAGHAAFWDDAANFNQRQREFLESLSH
jgi:pimeloyl-ACP methyl ester carboxylesterase